MTQEKNDPTRPDETREFAVELARLAADDRCTNVKVLDLRGLSPVTDYFVIATGTSERQMATVGDHAKKLAKERSYSYIGSAGMDDPSWILIDLADIVLHIFSEQTRSYYDLDMLWGDAELVDWQREQDAGAAQ